MFIKDFSKHASMPTTRVNERIICREVRLIGSEGQMIGVVSPEEGLSLAKGEGLDLVEISPNAQPPVCRIMDYGKFRYSQQKKAHEIKKKQKVTEVKEIKLRPNIAEGDYNIKIRNAIRFLSEGNKVKVSLQFRGREITHKEIGFEIMRKFQKSLEERAKIEASVRMEGRQIFMVLSPLSHGEGLLVI